MNSQFSIIALILVAFFQTSRAQLIEDFSDGNLDQNPTWQGDLSEFTINSEFRLQLNDEDDSNSESYLSTAAETTGNTTWEFWVNLDFSPSASNFAKVYLASNNKNLLDSPSGYFVQIGGISGDQDAVVLFRENNGNKLEMISGLAGGAGTGPLQIKVRVTRDENNLWELFTDLSGGNNFESRGTAMDAEIPFGEYFGVVCKYTSTRSEAFQFDDIFIDPLFIDETAPELISVIATADDALQLKFNESIAQSFSELNFAIDNSIEVVSAVLDSTDPTKILLGLSPLLTSGTEYTIEINNLEDESSNVLQSATAMFSFLRIDEAIGLDILITEIMADPAPVVALPEAEYIELYNNSSKNFDLNFYNVSSSGTPQFLPNYILSPDEYVIITDEDSESLFDQNIAVIGIPNFPQLSNSADNISLYNDDGELLHSVDYNESWYQDDDKKDGGYSLEMINLGNLCSVSNNWSASNDLRGGTPGLVNSISNFSLDENAPELKSVFTIDPQNILITFDEFLDGFNAEEISNYKIIDGPEILNAELQIEPNSVLLRLGTILEQGIIYSLEVSNISDCIGNTMIGTSRQNFSLPSLPAEGDIIMNEILFNPETGGVDFVEFFNISDKVIDASSLIIGNIEEDDFDIENIDVETLINPADYFVLCSSPSSLSSTYSVRNPEFLHQNVLPAFNNESGNVTLYTLINGSEVVLDVFDYNESFHSTLLDDKNGVSLERISSNASTQDSGNWHSSAKANGHATPTYENSQFIDTTEESNDFFSIGNKTFSPDADGYKDILHIEFNVDEPGYLATIKVFDRNGLQIKTLLNNELIGTSGLVVWDGSNEDAETARMGVYVLWVQLHKPNGQKKQFKETVVLAKRLN